MNTCLEGFFANPLPSQDIKGSKVTPLKLSRNADIKNLKTPFAFDFEKISN